GIGADRLLKLAIRAMTPKAAPPTVSIAHIHDVKVSVREHAVLLRDRIRRSGTATFQVLTIDCESTLEVVARFLALLELYRENMVGFDQVEALGELNVRWIAEADARDIEVDEYSGAPVTDDEKTEESDSE
ncbi:MAG TPA: segregation/condensation protein A, partial [Phytomonospora sp.]